SSRPRRTSRSSPDLVGPGAKRSGLQLPDPGVHVGTGAPGPDGDRAAAGVGQVVEVQRGRGALVGYHVERLPAAAAPLRPATARRLLDRTDRAAGEQGTVRSPYHRPECG